MLSGLLQPTHLIVLAVVALIFLGPKRLPDAGRALGQGLKEFKHSIGGGDEDQQIAAHAAVTPEERSPSP
jgi:sec-independent protein translocase protein TatA